ncbi:carbonic anhydrase [uncultured Gimesia sp.]|jgi:carbonic anhydrase|uniref:carbonic anhydrase n=1 Tax=uncultured Gimesia sp. TaxID=1678688 RepID=UPI002624F5F1|nr:carbonic anhydrase [uncultured Gimesia sp.]
MKTSQRTSACQCIKEVLNHGNMEFVEAIRREQQILETPKNKSDKNRLPDTSFIKQLGRLGETLQQAPKTVVLACSDARVPVLDLFQQRANEVFEIRLEGNVASTECLGSISYAVEHLPTIEGIVVLGHTGCGAITAAVDHYLSPKPEATTVEGSIMSLIKTIIPSVDIAASVLAMNSQSEQDAVLREALDRRKLIGTAIFVNAAAMAWKVQAFIRGLRRNVPVWYGVYDLASCRILHADLDRRDGSLLFGLGDAPHVTELNEVAQILVKYLQKMNNFDAAKFSTNGHNRQTQAAWEMLSTGGAPSAT